MCLIFVYAVRTFIDRNREEERVNSIEKDSGDL